MLAIIVAYFISFILSTGQGEIVYGNEMTQSVTDKEKTCPDVPMDSST